MNDEELLRGTWRRALFEWDRGVIHEHAHMRILHCDSFSLCIVAARLVCSSQFEMAGNSWRFRVYVFPRFKF